MGFPQLVVLHFIFFYLLYPPTVRGNAELKSLMELKPSLDPKSTLLATWTLSGDPCDGSFEGVACNEMGHVANISLQGKGLTGKLSPAVGGLEHLTGLYLHYNSLHGEIPREISNLRELSDLYLNMNNFSGSIPDEIGNMASLRVLQLCYNQFTGSIPTQLGYLKKLNVLALQSNQLTGAIPASLGDLGLLMRLDLSFNRLFGSIPSKLADAPLLEVLDVRNNTLSGNVPRALRRLNEGFRFRNNPGLCGYSFPLLRVCGALKHRNPNSANPYDPNGLPTREIPETANLKLNCSQSRCSSSSRTRQTSVLVGVILVSTALLGIGLMAITQYRRRKQKLRGAVDKSEHRPSTDQAIDIYRKNGSPLASLEYSNGWDPLAVGRCFGGFSQEVLQNFKFNLEEVESATQYFARKNLLGQSSFSAIYKGVLRDGSFVSIKCIPKTSCKSEEAEFLKGLNILASLRHENVVKLRGFCCSKGRGKCFLVYDFIPNGNLLGYLDLKEGDDQVLEWSTRVSIISGIAKGIAYLHGPTLNKSPLLHQNISAEKILISQHFKPMLSDSGLHKLLTSDAVFSSLKAYAALGCLAPEYTSTGRFTEKSDVFAFGMLVLQIISGKKKPDLSDFVDKNLKGNYSKTEADKLAKIALVCTHECPEDRPSMQVVVQDLEDFINPF